MKRELERRGDRIAEAIKRNQVVARIKDRAFPGRVLKDQFPIYRRHEEASCFSCGGDLTGAYWSKSGYARGRGAYVQSCEK